LGVEGACLVIDLWAICHRRCRFFIGGVFGGLVLVKLALDQAPGIGSGANQVFLGIIRLILIKFQLSLGYVELFLCSFLFSAGGRGELFLQLFDAVLIGLDIHLRLAGMFKEFAVLRRWCDRMVRRIAQSVMKVEVHFVVGEFRSLIRETMLVRARRQLNHCACRLQRPLVHQWSLLCRCSGGCRRS
jgi:hypothetical protein